MANLMVMAGGLGSVVSTALAEGRQEEWGSALAGLVARVTLWWHCTCPVGSGSGGLWAGPALNKLCPWHHRDFVRMMLPTPSAWVFLFGVFLGFVWNSWCGCPLYLLMACSGISAQLLAGSRIVFLKIFVHRFLCLGLGSNVLLRVVSFARDKLSHPLAIPPVLLSTSCCVCHWHSYACHSCTPWLLIKGLAQTDVAEKPTENPLLPPWYLYSL